MTSKLYDYVCAAEYDGEEQAILFILTLPEDQGPNDVTEGEAAQLFLKHWTEKRPCPGGRLHIGLPAESMEAAKVAIRERRCHTVRIDAIDQSTTGRPN